MAKKVCFLLAMDGLAGGAPRKVVVVIHPRLDVDEGKKSIYRNKLPVCVLTFRLFTLKVAPLQASVNSIFSFTQHEIYIQESMGKLLPRR